MLNFALAKVPNHEYYGKRVQNCPRGTNLESKQRGEQVSMLRYNNNIPHVQTHKLFFFSGNKGKFRIHEKILVLRGF